MKNDRYEPDGTEGQPAHTPAERELTVQERTLRIRAELRKHRAPGAGPESLPGRRRAPYWTEWWNYFAAGWSSPQM